ncbi:MAG TPA: hypothetical protein VEU96_31165 [Bryobacteraceae bacterium]|nr:hypothetical protein [Bryobacteraceae bacterium]
MKIRCVLLLVTAGICAFGQESKDEIIQKLISRVEALEREVAALKQPTAPVVVPPAPAQSTEQLAAAPVELPPAEQPEPSRFTFRGFGDVGFLRNVDGLSTKRFALGEVDLFATVRISPKVTALLETVLETDNQVFTSQVPINVERALLQYRANDYFNLDLGSYRTALGYYSMAYLRGSWFQTAVSRPRMFAFEDDGGILPLHNVGVSANGRIPSGALGLHYVAEVGSSRNYAQPARIGTDLAQNRALNVAVFAQPRSVRGLQFGFSSYHDQFSPAPGYRFERSIWTVHAVYQAHRLEFLNEAVLENATHPTLGHIGIPGFYSQAAYRVGSNWNPYLRFDYANVYGKYLLIDSLKQYLPWRTIFTGGIRYDLSESVAFKVEVGRETNRFQPPWIKAAAQVAFTF